MSNIKNSNELFTSKRFHRDSPVGMMKIPTVLAMGHLVFGAARFRGVNRKMLQKWSFDS